MKLSKALRARLNRKGASAQRAVAKVDGSEYHPGWRKAPPGVPASHIPEAYCRDTCIICDNRREQNIALARRYSQEQFHRRMMEERFMSSGF